MLPYFQREVRGIGVVSIQDIFSASASIYGYQLIEKTQTSAIAVQRETYSLKAMITCCIPGSIAPMPSMSSVKLEILSDEYSKLVVIRGLSGSPESNNEIINDFKNKLNLYSESPQDNRLSFRESFDSKPSLYLESEPSTSLTPRSNALSLDIHKILTTSQQGYNVILTQFMSELRSSINDQVFQVIRNKSEQITKDILLHHPETVNSLHYTRSIVEKFIYSKLYPDILSYYQDKNVLIDTNFSKVKAKLKIEPQKILNLLQVSEIYQLNNMQIPYAEAKLVLDRLNKLKTPLDKINCLISTVACMKSCVVEYWKGSVEIQTMDDELPLLMYLLLISKIQNPQAEFNILSLYVSEKLENESRIILNFVSAVSYLAFHFQY
jgi:Vacuolar sorting protein 9 (VPS9) domain